MTSFGGGSSPSSSRTRSPDSSTDLCLAPPPPTLPVLHECCYMTSSPRVTGRLEGAHNCIAPAATRASPRRVHLFRLGDAPHNISGPFPLQPPFLVHPESHTFPSSACRSATSASLLRREFLCTNRHCSSTSAPGVACRLCSDWRTRPASFASPVRLLSDPIRA